MNINRKWLEEKGACCNGKEWFLKQGIEDPVLGLENLIKHDNLDWANWLIVRVMTRPQYLAYAIYAAEQVIHIWENKYPDDDRPQKAIQAVKDVLDNDTPEMRSRAAEAAEAARAAGAAWAAGAAGAARAAEAAWAAGAARAAWAAEAAWAAWAAEAAWAARAAARKNMQLKILEYGISLLAKVAQEWAGARK